MIKSLHMTSSFIYLCVPCWFSSLSPRLSPLCVRNFHVWSLDPKSFPPSIFVCAYIGGEAGNRATDLVYVIVRPVFQSNIICQCNLSKIAINCWSTCVKCRTWLLDPPEVCDVVEAALKGGYRQIDCAHIYGNELFIGETLQKCFKEGVCKREDIFITSKLWWVSHFLFGAEYLYAVFSKKCT